MGIKLLDRSTRCVEITEAGSDFLDHARRIIETYNEMQVKMNTYKDKSKKNLTIGTIPVMGQYGITSLIASFTKQHRDIDINIIEDKSTGILALLDSSKIVY